MKMQEFKNQAVRAQDILYHNSKLRYLGNLSSVNKLDFDYKFCSDSDPLRYNITGNGIHNIKEEKYYKDDNEKLESNAYQDWMSDCSDGKCEEAEIKFVEKNLDLKVDEKVNDQVKKVFGKFEKKIKSRNTEDKELKDKFTTVIFSEDEMIRNREEKRNQPNFKKILYKCDSCVLGFTRKEKYNLHYEKKHDESIGPFACAVCSTRFPTPRARDSHHQRHYTCYRCRLCKYETLQRGSVVSHCRVQHVADSSGAIHCEQCGFVARTPEDLAEHKRTEHILSCDECGETFKGKHTLRTHKIRIHKSKRDYICDMCRRTFKTKSRLESHMVTHNSTLAQKLSYCSVCDVQYKNIYVYRNHLKNSANHSERLYHCQDCDKRFASKVYWQKHCDFYHLKKSQYKCHICDKLLISDWRLKTHMQTRHGSKRTRNHSCDVCEKKFFTVPTLRAHQLTHSTHRSYMCEQCGDTFKQRAALHTHTRAVHSHTRT